MSTSVSLVGTIGTTPKLLRSAANVAFCSFRLASTPRRYDRAAGTWVDGETSWYTVNTFRGLAEHASASLSLGDRVVVSGRLRVRDWKAADRSGTNVEIEADGLGLDLRWGTSQFFADPRAQEAASDAAGDAAGGEQQGESPDASSPREDPDHSESPNRPDHPSPVHNAGDGGDSGDGGDADGHGYAAEVLRQAEAREPGAA